jgi:hypothetical protein
MYVEDGEYKRKIAIVEGRRYEQSYKNVSRKQKHLE